MAAAHSSRLLVIKLTTNFSPKRNAKSHWKGKKKEHKITKEKENEKYKYELGRERGLKRKHTQEKTFFFSCSISFLIPPGAQVIIDLGVFWV